MLDFNIDADPPSVPHGVGHDLEAIRAALRASAADWVPRYFPHGRVQPDRRAIRCANLGGDPPRKGGSAVINLTGRHAGSGVDFGTGETAGPIDLLGHATGLTGAALFEEAARVAGLSPEPIRQSRQSSIFREMSGPETRPGIASADTRALPIPPDPDQRARDVARILRSCGPLPGSLAEVYLRGRGLGLPDTPDLLASEDLTDHATLRGYPGMVAVLRDGAGAPTGGIHRTFLSDDGRDKARAVNTGDGRKMLGPARGGHVRLAPIPSNGHLGVAEGIETALAAMQLFSIPTWAALSTSGLRAFVWPAGVRQVTLFADADRDGMASAADLADRARRAGLSVRIIVPLHGDDINDDLLKGATASDYPSEDSPLWTPTYPAPSESVAAARTRLRDEIAAWGEDAARFTADPDGETLPCVALSVGVGLGKSRVAREELARRIQAGGLATPVVLAVPTHALGSEQVTALEHLGITAMLWRGRASGLDPDTGVLHPDRCTCDHMDAVEAAVAVLAPIERSACRTALPDGTELVCPAYQTCLYQAQKPIARQADVVVVAHASLFHRRPNAIPRPGALVIDEGFWAGAMRLEEVGLDEMTELGTSLIPHDMEASNDLVTARGQLARAVRACGVGEPVRVEALRAAGLTAGVCGRAWALEWWRKVKPGLHPGLTAEERRQCLERARGNGLIPRMCAVWELAADALRNDHDAGALRLTRSPETRALSVTAHVTQDIAATWGATDQPVLHLDATLEPRIVHRFLPAATVAPPIGAPTPHARIRQILDAPTSQKVLLPRPSAPRRDHVRSAQVYRELRTVVRLRARALRDRGRAGGPDLLVISQKRAIERLRQETLPVNVEATHFNALRGLDRWGGVAGMMVIGRTMPAPREAEDLAAALTNRPPSARPEGAPKQWWYDVTTRVIRLPDGQGHPVRADLHPDPDCEAIRWAICEGELIQAIGRARAVNRTATDPVEIDILTDVVLPGEVHTVASWTDVRPGRIEAMIAEGVFLENAADMARAFPELWSSAAAARQDIHRAAERSVTFCYYRNSLIAFCHTPLRVRYRLTGPGQKARDAIFDASVVPDPQAWLQARVGPLAAYHIIDISEENDAEPASRQADPGACAPEDTAAPDTPFSFWMCPQPRPEGKE